MSCDAIRYGDTMMCGPCGLQWDTSDADPPACLGKNPSRRATDVVAGDTGRPIVATIATQVPTELPPALAEAMARAYEKAAGYQEGSPGAAMQAAYRVLIDSLP